MRILAVTAAAVGLPNVLASQQEVVGHDVMLSKSSTSVAFELADGTSRLITVGHGRVMLDGAEVATYEPRGAFEQAWLELVTAHTGDMAGELLATLRAFASSTVSGGAEAQAALADALNGLDAAPLTDAVVVAPRARDGRIEVVIPKIPPLPDIVIPEIAVSPGGRSMQIVESGSAQVAGPSIIGSVGAGAASLVGALIAMTLMGFGYLVFAPRQLRAVSDTAWNSFGRSFLAGMFAQPLLLPAFGALMAALALTVVGILLIPLAIPAFALAVFLGITGGYLAVARSVGEIYLRRRNHGVTPSEPWVELKFIWYGLIALMSIWLPAILFGWIPVVGPGFIVLAAVVTWVIATAGFGASIISRGGIRGTVMRRLDRTLSEGDYWADTGSFRSARSMVER
ncbi:MAG TPA: hypothetical protein VGA22_11690 [Gemmatimonadales bacterium]